MIHIDWKPEKNSEISIKEQIIGYFLDRIVKGMWPIGAAIPPQRELAKAFDVNRSTIVVALDELKADGILEGRGRAGTYVAENNFDPNLPHQTKWQQYIDEGIHIPNYKTIKMINDNEINDKILRLSSGEASPSMFSKERMAHVLNEVSKEINHLGYEGPTGMQSLREEVSKYLKTTGIEAPPSSILIVSGALQAIQLIAMGILQRGSTVFVEKPSYLYSLQILQTLGMRRVGLPMNDPRSVKDLIRPHLGRNKKGIMYVIPNYQNPTSRVMSLEDRKEVMTLCSEEKLPIIEDDVYGELWIDSPPPASLKSLDVDGNVLYIGSVSKTLSPGLRIGWVVGPETVINRLADIKMQMDYGSSSLSQLTVAKWLESGLYQEHLKEMRTELRRRRDLTLAVLDQYFSDIAEWSEPAGGFFVWIKLRDAISMYKVFEEALRENILFYPGYVYDVTPNDYLRISYSYASHDELAFGLKTLASIIKKRLEYSPNSIYTI